MPDVFAIQVQDEETINLDVFIDDQELVCDIIDVFLLDVSAAFNFVEIVRVCRWIVNENICSDGKLSVSEWLLE
jgi:hypothetical protein